MFKGLTKRCKTIINEYSIYEVERYNHTVIQPEHILIAMLKEGQSNAFTVMSEVIDLTHFQFILESHISKMKDETQTGHTDILLYYNISLEIPISDRTKSVLHQAINEAHKIGAKQIDTFALFLACCEEEGSISRAIIMRHEVVLDDLRNNYYNYIRAKDNNQLKINKENLSEKNSNFITDNNLPEIKNLRFQKFIRELDLHTNNDTQKTNSFIKDKEPTKHVVHALKHQESKKIQEHEYLYDMTSQQAVKKTTHIFGREKELEQLCRVLLRKEKNNPLLVGDAGVGKSAIIEELSLRIVEGNVPLPLLDAKILQLDLAALTAGTRFRGDFEERLIGVLEEIKSYQLNGKKAILFIDEFHQIIGSGQASGFGLDGASILKNPLARGDIACIGITTADDYRKCLENDKAFIRRLQKIEINEMSDDDTLLTLHKVKPVYEEKHHVNYSEDAILEIIRLSKNYIFDRHFPDKAIDLLDEVGAHNQLKNLATPKILSDLYLQEISISSSVNEMIDNLENNNVNVIKKEKLENTDALRDIITRKNQLQVSLMDSVKNNKVEITSNHVRDIISMITGIPNDRLNSNKAEILKSLDNGLKHDIVGQREAIHSLVSTVKRSYVGLHKSTRPIGSFMFLGPTGVGKTYTAKKLAHYLFGSEEALTRFDMSDFGESNSVNRLIGAPPGYVGFEDSGLLLKIVRRNPRQILLFDEIEKAHGRVFDMFLQILEEGKLQGQKGEYADFRHSIIVMTSNIGSKELLAKKNFGFVGGAYSSEYVEQVVKEELSNHFRPEFINRFDDIVVFDPLGNKEIDDVIDLMILELGHTLLDQGIAIKIHNNIKKLLHSKYYDVEYGARSVRRGIRAIENDIANIMIEKNLQAGDTLSIKAKDNQIIIKTIKKAKGSQQDSLVNIGTHDADNNHSDTFVKSDKMYA